MKGQSVYILKHLSNIYSDICHTEFIILKDLLKIIYYFRFLCVRPDVFFLCFTLI